MIKKVQNILLKDVRGHNKGRGEFRKEQVWIGSPGCKQSEAEYVPPKHEDITNLLNNWEKYIHLEDQNALIQSAIIHAQFEMIHPFVDGNGRVGRILIPLYLYQRSIISEPMFYLSGYLEEHKDIYTHSLSQISKKKDWLTWIKFFLVATNEQAKQNINTLEKINQLHTKIKSLLQSESKSPYQSTVLDTLFMFPLFTQRRFVQNSNMSTRTAQRLIAQLEDLGVIKSISQPDSNKPAIYIFPALYRILNAGL